MKSTIRSSREIDAVFREGKRAATATMVVLASKTPHQRGLEGRVAFVAGRSIGNAPDRNRAKRVLREAARRAGAPWSSWDVVLVARRGAGKAAAPQLDADLAAALARVGVS